MSEIEKVEKIERKSKNKEVKMRKKHLKVHSKQYQERMTKER